MKAVILAGGLGTRLRPFTQVIPKPLLPIGDQSVLEIQVKQLKEHGFDEIFLATSYKADYIRNFFGDGSQYGVKITISKEEEPLGTVGPLSLLRDQLDEPFILMNGDVLSLVDHGAMYEFAAKLGTTLTVGLKRYITPMAFGKIEYDGDFVLGVEEKPDFISYILSGIYVMTPDVFQFIPDGQRYGLDQLIQDMLEKSEPIAKYDIKEYWLDIGQIDDYEKAQAEFLEEYEK